MTDNLNKIFKDSIEIPNSNLRDDIWLNVVAYKKKQDRINLWIYSAISIVSVFGFIPALTNLFSASASSGVGQYMSLLISDGGRILTTYSKEFTLSLVESIPMTSLILNLAILFVLSLSLKRLYNQVVAKTLLA